MRYPASEKLEIVRLVERSHLPVRRTLDKLGIPATTFYRWYDRYRAFGEAGLEDRTSGPGRIWNRIPDDVRRRIVDLALDEPELSPRELAVTFTDTKGYFVSEASVYRECQKICARAVLSDIDEPFAEDDGELCFGLEPFPRRTFPRLGRMIENEI